MAPRKTHEEYIKELAVKNPTLEVIGKYAGAKTKILHHCLIHDVYWDMQPTNALQGCGCKKCQKDKTHITRYFTTEQYSLEVKKINKNIIVLEEYINIREPILHKCLLHNVTWKAYPYLILRGCGCRQCGNEKIGNKLRKTHEEYVEEVKLIDKNIVVIGQYIDSKTPILHKCSIDSYEWYAIPTNILRNHGCPKCNESIGEKTIQKYLDNNRIAYLPQYTFYGCSNLNRIEFLATDFEYVDRFCFCDCFNLSEIISLSPTAFELNTGADYNTTFVPEGVNVYKFHPWGYNTFTFVGKNVTTEKVLYVPYNKNNGYLTNKDWIKPLQTPEACGFMVKYITLDNIVTLNGSLLNDYQIVYLKSDSGNFVNDGNVESTTKGENGFIIQFNGKVYDSETIYVYSDSECTNLIGNFVAKYGVTEYALDAVMSVSRNTTLFSSDLFGTSSTVDLNSNTEMANITKLEYEILVSKVNQLMKLLKNKK